MMSRYFTQTPIIPIGLIDGSGRKAQDVKPDATKEEQIVEEPVSYRMVDDVISALNNAYPENLRTLDTESDQLEYLEKKEKDSERLREILILQQEAVESLPKQLVNTLKKIGSDPNKTSFHRLVEQLIQLRRRLYKKERQLVGAIPSKRFAPGSWRKTPDLGWTYVLPRSINSALTALPQTAYNANLVYADDIGGWVVVTPPDMGITGIIDTDVTGASFKVVGVTDLLIVEQNKVRYQAGEIAHIENVLEGEKFLRSHRKFTRTEELFETETETSEENERDIQSSEKFELEREVSQLLKEQQKIEFGARVSASYGPTVSVETELGIEDQTATEQAQRSASRFSSSLTERAVTRIRERQRELRRLLTVSETEESSEHSIARGPSDGNMSGVYQWVDKFYEMQTMNYGKRLMLEATIPEPGAYLRYLRSQHAGSGGDTPPEPFTITFEDVTEDTYDDFSAIWQAGDIKPPPHKYEVVGVSAKARVSSTGHVHHTGQIRIPNGYRCISAQAVLHRGPDNPQITDDPIITLAGLTLTRYRLGRYSVSAGSNSGIGELPFTLGTYYVSGQTNDIPFSITAICERTDESYQKWQIETFNSLLQGFMRLQSDFEESVASSEGGVVIQGMNPNINRENELQEVRKLCVEAIARAHLAPIAAIQTSIDGGVHINFNSADFLSYILQFFEDAFEWENIAYDLYPYFWAGPEHVDLKLLEDPDPAHISFLRAGAAKVRIPVRPGFEREVLYFIDLNELYTGDGQAPISEDRLPLVDDIEKFVASQPAMNQPIPYDDPWLTLVPTTFVTLRKDSGLPSDWITLSPLPAAVQEEDDNEANGDDGNVEDD
jgi:hypothetical protein